MRRRSSSISRSGTSIRNGRTPISALAVVLSLMTVSSRLRRRVSCRSLSVATSKRHLSVSVEPKARGCERRFAWPAVDMRPAHIVWRGRPTRRLSRPGGAAGIAVCAELCEAADRSTERRVCPDASSEIGAIHAPSSQRVPRRRQAAGVRRGDGLAQRRRAHAADVLGRVVLVSFGTYTCINWIRSLPYVRAWADKYASRGADGRRRADARVRLRGRRRERAAAPSRRWTSATRWRSTTTTPSGRRSTTTTGRPCTSPTREGRIRHHHFGEGEYEQSEMVLQMLLREAGAEVDHGLVRIEPAGVEAAADWASLGSPESYVGYERAAGFASPGGLVPDERHVYSAPAALRRNQWALAGEWQIGAVPALLGAPGGSLSYQFHARDLNLVMGPPPGHGRCASGCASTASRPGDAHGIDVDATGDGHRRLPADVPADPPARADRRPAVRDRVPRRRRRGVRVHVRMTRGGHDHVPSHRHHRR